MRRVATVCFVICLLAGLLSPAAESYSDREELYLPLLKLEADRTEAVTGGEVSFSLAVPGQAASAWLFDDEGQHAMKQVRQDGISCRFTLTYRIPNNWQGEKEFQAAVRLPGSQGEGYDMISDPVTIEVSPDWNRLVLLDVDEGRRLYLRVGEKLRPRLYGVFSDGRESFLGTASPTTYSSSDEEVAAAASDGTIHGLARGQTQIMVENGGLRLMITALVEANNAY